MSGLLAILDHSDDASVYREILKIIVEINLTPKDFELIHAPMLDLGWGCYTMKPGLKACTI